jgi:hypothetical protein
MQIEALEQIESGTELTINYGDKYFKGSIKKRKICLCEYCDFKNKETTSSSEKVNVENIGKKLILLKRKKQENARNLFNKKCSGLLNFRKK